MQNNSSAAQNEQGQSHDKRPLSGERRANSDVHDPKRDQEKLKPDEGMIELPDVTDIPGQEFIRPAPLGALGDTTISSADEEGDEIFGDENKQ